MKKKHTASNVLTWIVSLVIALTLWNYIINRENPTRTLEYRDIMVQLVGADDLYNSYNLSVIDGGDSSVSVKVSASTSRLANLTASQIKAKADLSESISAPGTYEIPYEVILPESGMSCVSSTPSTISVTVDRVETKSVPVNVKIVGKAKSGYKLGSPVLSTESVNITGPERELANVANAEVVMDARNLTQSIYDMSCDYKLVDREGKSINSGNISRETTRVKLLIDVFKVKKVPLKVVLTPDDIADEMGAEASLSTNEVEIQGDAKTVDAVQSIEVGSINVNKAENGDVFTFDIDPPKGTELTDGQEKTVRAVLKLDETQHKDFKLTDITIKDTAESGRKKATLNTDEITVTLSGSKRTLENIESSDLSATAEINSAELTSGKHRVGVNIETPDKTMLHGSYSVQLTIGN